MRMIRKNLVPALVASAASFTVAGAALALSLPLGSPSDGVPDQGQPTAKRPVLTESSINFGVYDPHGDFSSESKASIEHLFLPWEDVDLSLLPVADAYALERGRTLMITVEPWSWSVDWRVSAAELLDGIIAGTYDANMAAVCMAAAELKSPITIRWGQEMDETDSQFLWAQWSPEEFIAAYRRIVTECRKHLPDATYVWSPKGNPSLVDFYPGDAYVDVVGLSVFGYQPYDKSNYGGERTFAQALEPGYRLVSGLGKPIMIAELGYEGDLNYVSGWAKAVATPHSEFPKLTAVVYFNDREVYPWPHNAGLPNWRVGSASDSAENRAD